MGRRRTDPRQAAAEVSHVRRATAETTTLTPSEWPLAGCGLVGAIIQTRPTESSVLLQRELLELKSLQHARFSFEPLNVQDAVRKCYTCLLERDLRQT